MKTGAAAHVASPGPYNLNVTVSPANAFTRPVTVAVSLSTPAPSLTVGDACVVIKVTAKAPTSAFSLASLHRPATGGFVPSPLYEAIHRYVPANVGVNAGELTGPPPIG